MVFAGLSVLWSVRRTLVAMGKIDGRPSLEAAAEALRRYHNSAAGGAEIKEFELGEKDN